MKVYGSTLFSVTRGWVGVQFPGKKCYVSLTSIYMLDQIVNARSAVAVLDSKTMT